MYEMIEEINIIHILLSYLNGDKPSVRPTDVFLYVYAMLSFIVSKCLCPILFLGFYSLFLARRYPFYDNSKRYRVVISKESLAIFILRL